jgi:hypothetical protein
LDLKVELGSPGNGNTNSAPLYTLLYLQLCITSRKRHWHS